MTFSAVIIILISILLVQRLAFYLNQVIDGSISQSAVLSLLGLQVIRFITELLPLSFLLASILGFGRLYKDSEMAAMFALGMPVKELYKILLMLTLPLSFILMILNFWLVPEIARTQDIVLQKARESAQLTIFKPGIFKEFARGKHTVYVQNISNDGSQLNNIFIRSLEEVNEDRLNRQNGFSITTAKSGKQLITEDETRFIILENGSRYFDNGKDIKEKIFFEELKLRLDSKEIISRPKALSFYSRDIINSSIPAERAEFHRRLSGSISLFILIIMIPALSHSRPREGQFNKLILGLIIYVLYFNLIGIAQTWIHKDQYLGNFGLWWVHLLMLMIALTLAYRHSKQL